MAMFKKKVREEDQEEKREDEYKVLHKKTIKEIIAPAGIDASKLDHMEIVSNVTRYARSFFVSGLPRSCTFPELFRSLYMFGDINTSIYIYPVSEASSQNDLNKTIVELETERLMASDKGNINRESDVSQKRYETEILRDQIAAGFNKLYEATIVSTLFAYSMQDLERLTKLLSNEMSKSLVSIKSAWAMQEDAFKTCLPLMENTVQKKQIFDRPSMGTVFPFLTSEVGHPTGVPLGINKQTGEPILFDNFHPSLTNYNMVIFAKSGAGKSVTMKTLISRSSVLMGIESLALDAEGEYYAVAEALGGINVIVSPNSSTIINVFDIEVERAKDAITGREREVLNIENKVEDVTQALMTMAKGSTKTEQVNELTKQIISESVAAEYAALGITSDPMSLYENGRNVGSFGRKKKLMPTIGSWYKRLEHMAQENDNEDYRFHYSYLLKVMKQYIREFGGQMAYFDGQSTFELLDGAPFINIDISQLEERFARPLAQQILLSWIWEKFVKKNSEDRKKARQKRVIVDEAWMLLPFPEAVDFLNKMARRARKRNVSLAIISQRFQDFYEKPEAQAVLTSSDTKLFLAQDKSEIALLQEVFKLSSGEASFLVTCTRGEGLLKVGSETAILQITPTQKEFKFVETNLNKLAKES
ncbi:MAG: VirB4 family type IV secretion system protein [Clostridia bacterium]|jgi:conjugal transfer ATP-binding protein TraC